MTLHFAALAVAQHVQTKNAKFLMAWRAWAWFRANAAPLGVGTPIVGVFASYVWNATETHRMARKIRRGYFQPKAPADYDHRFCLFDRYMMEKAQMVGLVGLKSTGKSSTLSHFLRERPNPFHLSLTHGNLYDAMYDEMKKKVLCLPFFADHLRWDAGKNSKDIVIEVFELVQEQTGSPVQVGVDVVLNPPTLPVEGADKAVMTVQGVLLGTASSFPFFSSINIIKLVKDVKWLCADARVASAVIASGEGLELLSVNEPRLEKLMAEEMPLEKAKEYLQHIHAEGHTEEMLKNIPRTFGGWRSHSRQTPLQQSAWRSSQLQGHLPALQRQAELRGEFRETQPLYPHSRCEVQVPIRLCSRGSKDCVRPVNAHCPFEGGNHWMPL